MRRGEDERREKWREECTKVDAVVHDHWPLGNSIQWDEGLWVQMLRKLVVWGLQMHVHTCTTVNC